MQFACHGIPDTCVSDNGPQFASEYKKFSRKWKFELVTTSPRYPKSNGRVKTAVGAAQRLMRKAKKGGSGAYLALLDYRNTPTQGLDTSPVQASRVDERRPSCQQHANCWPHKLPRDSSRRSRRTSAVRLNTTIEEHVTSQS